MSLYDAAPYILAIVIVLFCATLGEKKRRQATRPRRRTTKRRR